MADNYFIGAAPAVAQVVTIAITGYDAATTYRITVGGKIISVVGSGGSTSTVATALAAAWNASTHPYCTGITASANTATVTLTADTAGVPFVVTSSVSGGGGTIGAATTATASAGPNDWSTAANWSTGSVPVNGDSVWIRNTSVPILWGLAQSGVTPALLAIEHSFTGTLGLPYQKFTTALGTYDTSVPEYRATYLAIGAAEVVIGENLGSAQQSTGSGLVKVDLGSTNAAVKVYRTGSSNDSLAAAVRLKLNHASATLKVYGGQVGVCWESPADTGELSAIEVYGGSDGAAEVYVGDGVTLATLLQVAGIGVIRNAPTTLKVENGARVTAAGTGTITTLEKRGELVMAGSYTVTTLRG